MKRMTILHTLTRALPIAGLAVLLAGCADNPIFDKTPARNGNHPKAVAVMGREASPPPKPKERSRDDAAVTASRDAGLREGIRMYDEGDFNGAIKRLSARDLSNGPPATRLAALKYTAFSYCVTSRPAQCRQSFDKALRLDPDFDLAPGEHGHPLWGPVFTQAKQAAVSR